MKRAQQDHGSSTSITTRNPPRANLPSITADSPTPRSRRASDYPPLSHQTQIMKAVRRSAALPSLSLSVPPSPVQAMTTRLEGSVEDFSLTKEDHVKTVTFSEPEDEELSDDSSICQSPSWEQYGQRNKKKPKKSKKEANQKTTKDKEETALKRRSNRLVKSAPVNPFAIKPLTASDRSVSAPELSLAVQPDKMNSQFLSAESQVALGKHHPSKSGQGSVPKEKPKGRGLFSSFGLQRGNVAAVRELVGVRKSTDKGAEKGAEKGAAKGVETGAKDSDSLRSIQYETIPAQQPNGNRPGVDPSNPRPKKPASIRSIISTSDHSHSSQEKRGSGAQAPTGSGHARSQSLLSSTLNKLRGPSYLYYQHSGEGSTSDHSKHRNSSQDFEPMHNHATDTPVDRTVKISDEKDLTNLEHPQQPFDFAFSPKHKRVNTEPSPEIAPRGRQPRPRKVEIQEPDLEQEAPVLRPSGARRVQIEVPQMSTRDSVMARVAAQERQSQTARISRQYRQAAVGNDRALDTTEDGQDGGVELNGKLASLPNRKGEVHRSGKAHTLTASAPSSDRPNETEGKLTPDPQKNNTLKVGDRDLTEDDEVSVGTHASTIRPVSRSHDSEPMDNKKQQNSSVSRGSEPRAYATELETREGKPDFVTEMSVDDLITFDTDVPDTLQHPLQPQREMDYFASFCDSYLPPVLDLQSPGTGNRPSPRFPFSEESDEDNGHSVYRDYMQDDYTGQMNIVEEKQKAGRANGPRPKGIGKFSNEQKSKNSPATATQNSDSDVPVFERLSVPSTAAKTSTGGEMAGTSTAHPQQTDPSRTTSERSSSSTCDDSPPSPSSATTLDSSRPQSRKGTATFQTETSRVTILEPTPRTDSRASRRGVNSTLSDRAEGAATQGLGLDADVSVGGWSEVTTKSNAEQQPTPTLAKTGAFALNPSVDATPTSVNFADALIHGLEKEDEQNINQHPGRSLPPRTQSALDLHSTTGLMSRPLRPQRLHLKPNDVTSSVSLPNSPPLSDFVEEVMPRKSALKMSRNNSTAGHESSTTVSMGAAYLQEARKTAPIASASSSRALRPHFSQKHSSGSVGSAMSAGNRAEPLAKMLVECCNCHFFHDMPSRVYECMAKPDSVVEDKLLGVSAAITTMVRCPWCAHGMTTQCCSGYAAVVYLKEKLH